MVGEERIELSLLAKHDFELYAYTIAPYFIGLILCLFWVYYKCTIYLVVYFPSNLLDLSSSKRKQIYFILTVF